jgi:polyphosphate kinase
MKWIDREVSWLQFNERVIAQACRTDFPMIERFRFIGIAASNLDEFISVRFAHIYNTKDEQEPLYTRLLETIREQKQALIDLHNTLLQQVGLSKGIVFDADTEEYFDEELFTALSPVAIDSNKELPVFNGLDINLFIKFEKNEDEEDRSRYCIIQIPFQLRRVEDLKVPYYNEDIIANHLDRIFANRTIEQYLMFKVIKQADIEIDDNPNTPITKRVNKLINRRKEENIWVDVIPSKNGSGDDFGGLTKKLIKLLRIPKKHVFIATSEQPILALEFLKKDPYSKFIKDDEKYPAWKKFKPTVPSELFGEESIFEYVEDDDLIVHHPYETFELFIEFLREAAEDKNTLSIKQTLYRVSSVDSPVIDALCDAARNGIKVTVMLELLARFDEAQNMRIINRLKEAGVLVVYSIDGLKTHCKICLVTKSTKKGKLLTYSHIGTGNYNEQTAKIYTDISYFTGRSAVAHDLNTLFNMITGFNNLSDLNLKKISYSPITLRTSLEEMIREYSVVATEEDPVVFRFKMNSISDPEMVQTIYQAADNPHVRFEIICRGICSLVPRENIQIKSIVGRFLEHSRIYSVEHKDKKELYISSADLLTRNLDRRIEVMIPVNGRKCKKKVEKIFDVLWRDTVNSFIMDENGLWRQGQSKEGRYNAHAKLL